ncbi:MAG: hypothetical protein IT285_05225 [Bdellovibrionales bacterium]|nr:hypothetical protein [Bdellovibrionales bacterium]
MNNRLHLVLGVMILASMPAAQALAFDPDCRLRTPGELRRAETRTRAARERLIEALAALPPAAEAAGEEEPNPETDAPLTTPIVVEVFQSSVAVADQLRRPEARGMALRRRLNVLQNQLNATGSLSAELRGLITGVRRASYPLFAQSGCLRARRLAARTGEHPAGRAADLAEETAEETVVDEETVVADEVDPSGYVVDWNQVLHPNLSGSRTHTLTYVAPGSSIEPWMWNLRAGDSPIFPQLDRDSPYGAFLVGGAAD